MTKTQFTDILRRIPKKSIPWIAVAAIGLAALLTWLGLGHGSGELPQDTPDAGNTDSPRNTVIVSAAPTDAPDPGILQEADNPAAPDGQAAPDEFSGQPDEPDRLLQDEKERLAEEERRLAAARQELDAGWARLREPEKALAAVKQQLDDSGKALLEAQVQLSTREGLSGASAEAYNDGRSLWYAGGENYLDDLTRYEQEKEKLEQGERAYSEDMETYEQDRARYESALADYEAARRSAEGGAHENQ